MILKKTEKHENTLKKIILTSEPCVKHLFAGRNTQQPIGFISDKGPSQLIWLAFVFQFFDLTKINKKQFSFSHQASLVQW